MPRKPPPMKTHLTRAEGREYFNGRAPKGTGRYTVAPKSQRLVDGIQFDSMADAMRYSQLKTKSLIGEVVDLKYHHIFDCIINGVKVCRYEVDFAFIDGEGVQRYEEVKRGTSGKERDWRIRRKLVEALYGVTIDVVTI